tara:strand:+ start:818 stop:1861 length:1044 start_codon:yes stop_codon:yes gene_type:complete
MNALLKFGEVLKDSVKYRYFLARPNILILFVTSVCNFKCDTCFNWKNINNGTADLSLEEINKVSNNMRNIKSLLLSGGEPFIRNDLVDIIKIFYENNNTRTIQIPTNGFFTDTIIKKVGIILKTMTNLNVNIGISLDALGEKHDQITRTENAFNNAIQTKMKLAILEKKYTTLKSNFLTVISNQNINDIESLFNYINNNFGFENIAFFPIRGDHFSKNLHEPSYDEWNDVCRLYKNLASDRTFGLKQSIINRKIDFLNKLYLNLLKSKYICGLKCSAGSNICVIDANGNVRACELKSPLANLRDHEYDIAKILNKRQTNKCGCTHTCFINASLDISPIKFARSYLNL